MAKTTFNKNNLMIVIGILFALSVFPGQGTKAADQQTIVSTEYLCAVDTDCPKCVGGGISKFNETDPTFLGELSYAACSDDPDDAITGKVCQLSDACLVWDCGGVDNCKSVKSTILDNTIGKFNDNPMMLFLIVGLVVLYIFAGK